MGPSRSWVRMRSPLFRISAFSVESGMPRGLVRSSSEMISASVTSVLSSFVALSMICTSSPVADHLRDLEQRDVARLPLVS